jgi:hypothetical protein
LISKDNITWTGKIKDSLLEQEFRSQQQSDERTKARVICGLFSVITLIFLFNDHRLWGTSQTFWLLLVNRCVMVALNISIFFYLEKPRSTKAFDICWAIWLGMVVIHVFHVDQTRPPGFIATTSIDILILFVFYLGVLIELKYQILASTLFTVLGLGFRFLDPRFGSAIMLQYTVAFVTANLVGGLAAWFVHRMMRQQFLSFKAEENMREKLENTMNELKTLQGLLPICADCKKIREDDGEWKRLEHYISEHSDAKFTHGLCPDCVTKYSRDIK